jgi:PAS domain S-box-containing protein
MNVNEFSLQIKVWRSQLAGLLERSHESTEPEKLLNKAVEELHVALEELMVAEEEIRQQNHLLENAQELVEAERQRYRELFEFAPDGYLVTDNKGAIQEANHAAALLLNVPQRLLAGKLLVNFIPIAQQQNFRSYLNQLHHQDKLQKWEVRLKPRKHQPIDVAITMGAVRDRNGNLIAVRWLLRDLSDQLRCAVDDVPKGSRPLGDRKQVELERIQLLTREQEARKEAEAAHAQMTNILENITDGYLKIDTHWRYRYVNSQAEKLLCKKASEIIGCQVWDVFSKTANSQSYQLFHQAIAQQINITYEEFFPMFNKWFAIRLYPSPEGLSVYFLDITERKQTEVALRQQAAQLTQANRIKDEFLAIASHELRSPLSAILGWVQTLQNGSINPEMIARAIQRIEHSTRSQMQMVENLLDVSQIMTGKLEIHLIPTVLAPIIEGVINTVRQAANAKELQLQLKLDPNIRVFGDPKRLQQIIFNLLSNAIKFTPKGGKVEIRLSSSSEPSTADAFMATSHKTDTSCNSQESGADILPTLNSESNSPTVQLTQHLVILEVIDTGIGISPEFLPFVFEHFRQADSTLTRSYGGMGLGLAIVRHLVEMHGGTIRVASPGTGLGTTFTVELPLDRG